MLLLTKGRVSSTPPAEFDHEATDFTLVASALQDLFRLTGYLEAVTACLFCRIASRETNAATVLDEAELFAFLDHRPLFLGHCLLIPKKHIGALSDLPAKLVEPFFGAMQRLARAIELAMQAEGTFVAINNKVSQSVPHLHVHVVPRRKKDGLRGFFWPRQKYSSEQVRDEIAARIREALTDSRPER